MNTPDQYPWMQNVCYEPKPLAYRHSRRRAWVRPIFCTLAIIAVVCGGLMGLA